VAGVSSVVEGAHPAAWSCKPISKYVASRRVPLPPGETPRLYGRRDARRYGCSATTTEKLVLKINTA
jgi:hypothetical protein